MVEPINALSLIKEEMQTEEIHLKVNAIHRLKIVILSIGPEQVNSQLIPYLFSKSVSQFFFQKQIKLIEAHYYLS